MRNIVHENPGKSRRGGRSPVFRKVALVASLVASVLVAPSAGFVENLAHPTSASMNNAKPVVGDASTSASNTQPMIPLGPWSPDARTSRKNFFLLHQQKGDGGDDNTSESTMQDPNSNSNSNKKRLDSSASRTNSNRDGWTNLLVAAAFLTATVGGGGADSFAARAAATPDINNNNNAPLDLVSPGTATIETKIVGGDPSVLVRSTESTVTSLAKTAIFDKTNRVALTDSVKRIRSSVANEMNSVEAWRQVATILHDYGVDLTKETDVVVRPPADFRKMYDDLVAYRKLSLLVNGEILQMTLDYQKGSNDVATSVVQPDDEWVLRIRGYKGFDPTALNLALEQPSRYDTNTPQWYRDFHDYWTAPLSEDNVLKDVAGTNGGQIFLEGAAAVALSYAFSYAYYVELNEREAEEARLKQEQRAAAAKAKKEAMVALAQKEVDEKAKKAGVPEDAPVVDKKGKKKKPAPSAAAPETSKPAAVKPAPTPAAAAPETSQPAAVKPVFVGKPKPLVEEAAPAAVANTTNSTIGDLKVVIGFNEEGKVVLTAIDEGPRKENILAFLQAMYFPWLGFFVSSSSGIDDRPRIVRIVQALYFPWAGVFFPKESTTSNTVVDTGSGGAAVAAAAATSGSSPDTDRGNNGVLPLIRALWFPWIGILQGK
mmetsp:Transcript_62737/g.127830  ORF Transcript_62737/g.127830 Transcript_62737/m.127830 type:complete len:657 (-) Transcript_62737:255-2225(-)|eukprot:CAMPEP_0201185666 /NCGR_PEP_ID=MMETSP0851-20130426/129367_1 /ASSEMBLY_ACC=CAM_ASM_000631 /TAXON_ID=183588 /ORGANISM="Pseudo-nitzschia fraudulenta, Strain WWA7" /LENGTH=656 /DNA_ID=CAMNT_0047470851 /DNA_START=128 /DNA_END=2098 /DNA_ORIENTATION=+